MPARETRLARHVSISLPNTIRNTLPAPTTGINSNDPSPPPLARAKTQISASVASGALREYLPHLVPSRLRPHRHRHRREGREKHRSAAAAIIEENKNRKHARDLFIADARNVITSRRRGVVTHFWQRINRRDASRARGLRSIPLRIL